MFLQSVSRKYQEYHIKDIMQYNVFTFELWVLTFAQVKFQACLLILICSTEYKSFDNGWSGYSD